MKLRDAREACSEWGIERLRSQLKSPPLLQREQGEGELGINHD